MNNKETTRMTPETPFSLCRRLSARPGDVIRMTEGDGNVTEFVIVGMDEEAETVTWGLEGVWRAREWRELDRDATYALVVRGGAK